MIEAYILIEVSSGSKYKYVRNTVADTHGVDEQYYKYEGSAYQEVGLKRKHGAMDSGLEIGEEYYFRANVDGGGVTEYSIIPEGNSQGFVEFEEVIRRMNYEIEVDGALWSLNIHEGDLRCTSISEAAATSIALSAGVGGTDLFATLNGWTGGFDVAVAGDQYADQTLAGEVKKDFTDLTTAFTGAVNFNDLLPFPEAGGPVTILKRKNYRNGIDDGSYVYLQIPVGKIVSINVIEDIVIED